MMNSMIAPPLVQRSPTLLPCPPRCSWENASTPLAECMLLGGQASEWGNGAMAGRVWLRTRLRVSCARWRANVEQATGDCAQSTAPDAQVAPREKGAGCPEQKASPQPAACCTQPAACRRWPVACGVGAAGGRWPSASLSHVPAPSCSCRARSLVCTCSPRGRLARR